jgi:S-adenosylmethionine-diacylglycerol 3-amino-3-carboxypropyl transferase
MHVADRLYQQLFRHMFVYNMLFEDTEVDERFLDLGADSRVLGISGAGCGIAGYLSRRPRSIDAIDINANHLAIAALKAVSARDLDSYEEFYNLWGHGRHPDSPRLVARLTRPLPEWMRRHWRRYGRMFAGSFHQRGLTARGFATVRRLAKVDATWLRDLVGVPVVERRRRVAERFGPIFRTPWIATLLRSHLNLFAMGVNHAQRDRMLRAEGLNDIVDFLLMHLGRVAETDLERNWFVWVAIAGHYNHARADAVPPFMRKDHHDASRGAPTALRFHHKDIFDVLAAAGPKTWTHYTLLDAPDWMPPETQRRLLDEIRRTSVDGAVVLHRSVVEDSLPERHNLLHRFEPMVEESALATKLDRTRQYRSVNFHRVVH